MARKKRDPKSVELANRIIAEYAPESVEDMENGSVAKLKKYS